MGCERAIKRTSTPEIPLSVGLWWSVHQKILEEPRSPAETGNELPYYKQRHIFLIGQKISALSIPNCRLG